MQIVSHFVHQRIKSIAAASVQVTVKSMLSAAPPSPFCKLRSTAAASLAPRGVLVDSTGVTLSRGPWLSQLKRTNRLLHTALTCNLHVVSHTYVQSLTPQAVRGSRSLMAAASLQVTALAQQHEDLKDRTSHQKENPLDSILLQADSAVQPFLAPAAEQPARARVDYSKSQRPLQVLVKAQQSIAQHCYCSATALHYPASISLVG